MKPPRILVLAPKAESADAAIDYYYDFSQNQQEFERAFAELGLAWQWELVTPRTFRATVESFVSDAAGHLPVIFNLCDGDQSNDVPGIDVIHFLDASGLRYTGSNAHFYRATTSKIDMKHAFDRAGVATAPWSVVHPAFADAESLFKRLGTPLIVKPAVSAGSMGITVKSVVHSADELHEQVRLLHQGYHGWDLISGGVFVERYIAGPEFTTFIVGSAGHPARTTIYPPVERLFHAGLPATEQFLSYDRLWEVHEREAPMTDGAYLWEYQPAPAALRERIEQLSWDAYAAVGGHGYGRVDLRMDATTGELYVLEVNAQCGLSEDENHTSIGAILRFADRSFASLVSEILAGAQLPAVATRLPVAS